MFTLAQGMTAVGVLGALHMDVITDIAWSCDGRTLAVSTQLDSKASVKLAWVHKLVASCYSVGRPHMMELQHAGLRRSSVLASNAGVVS